MVHLQLKYSQWRGGTEMAGAVSPTTYQFTDIREITEVAAEARRNDREV